MLYFFNNKTKLYTCVWVAPEKKVYTCDLFASNKAIYFVQFTSNKIIYMRSVCPRRRHIQAFSLSKIKLLPMRPICPEQSHTLLQTKPFTFVQFVHISAIYMRSVCPQTKPYTCVQVAPKQSHINASSWSKQGAPVPQQVKRWPTGLPGFSPT